MNENGLLNRLTHNRFILRIVSVVLAFIVWFIIVVSVSPNYTRTISDIPITMDKSGFLSDAGLGLVDQLDQNISLQVYGPRTTIGKLNAKDFTVTPDVSSVTKSGTYSLPLSAAMKTSNSQIKIQSVSPAKVTVRFDTVASKNFQVKINVKNTKIADGYVMEAATASTNQVVLSGQTGDVSKVSQVIADVGLGDNADSTYRKKASLYLADASGNKLALNHVKINIPTVTVTVPIYKMKNVPLKINFQNIPSGFNMNNLQYSINPQNLHIAGAEKELQSLSKLDIGNIDFNNLSLTNQITMPIRLGGTLQNLENLSNVTVNINLLNTATKDITTQNIQTTNLPTGYHVQLITKQINGIHLFGPSNQMASPPVANGIIDLSKSFNGIGQYEVPVSISVPSSYWATGTYMAVINVEKS